MRDGRRHTRLWEKKKAEPPRKVPHLIAANICLGMCCMFAHDQLSVCFFLLFILGFVCLLYLSLKLLDVLTAQSLLSIYRPSYALSKCSQSLGLSCLPACLPV